MTPVFFNSDRTDAAWRHKTAADIAIKSRLQRQIGKMSVPAKGLLFAEYCLAAYLPLDQCLQVARTQLGLDECLGLMGHPIKLAEQVTWQLEARCFQNYEDCTVVLSSSAAPRWAELKAALNQPPVVGETLGRQQPVIKELADSIWPELESLLAGNYKPLRFAGHGVAGAVAAICANRCVISHIRSEPLEIHTFGAPRWGDPRLHQTHRTYHFRWALPHDPVTELPPAWLGYRHYGEQRTIDDQGRRQQPGLVQRLKDQGRSWRIAQFATEQSYQPEHAISRYVDALHEHVLRQG